MKCSRCSEELKQYEHYVELEDGTILDESCFFDLAIEKLNGTEKQHGYIQCYDED